MDMRTREHRRRIGLYETPVRTAGYMVEKLLPHLRPGDRVLDPAAGGGVFVRQLLQRGIAAKCIHAWDSDPEAIPGLLELTPHALLRDGLASTSEQFDAVIANPPYNSHECDYIRANREWLLREYGEIGLYNLYALFTAAAIRRLKEGGFACLILLDSFLTTAYHAKFRRFLLEHCKIHEILLAPAKLFHAGKADVRTVIITLEKCSHAEARLQNKMRLVDRMADESEYGNPPRVQILPQRSYLESDDQRFHICIPERIIELVNQPPARLSDVVEGGAGISTGNDAKYLRKAEEVGDDPEWVPFYKNSGGKAYLADTNLRIHRDWEKGRAESSTYLARNSRFYFQEGISCSSMGVRFSACYLPPGSLFGINANLFLKEGHTREDLLYLLGFLNSSLAQYILRAALNRTNMATPGYVKRLPWIEPDAECKRAVASLVERILSELHRNRAFNRRDLQGRIDDRIFDLYRISGSDRSAVTDFCVHLLARL